MTTLFRTSSAAERSARRRHAALNDLAAVVLAEQLPSGAARGAGGTVVDAVGVGLHRLLMAPAKPRDQDATPGKRDGRSGVA